MNVALWIVTGLLAVAYLVGGGFKVITPKEKTAASGPSARWVEDFSGGGVKTIGTLEVLAAAGLILPAALDIAPVLVPPTPAVRGGRVPTQGTGSGAVAALLLLGGGQ
ncbi:MULTISPECIES: DoxX family protein [unclassified Streptomyces]|uniref:DoxX family protein n=1 Tax=Streptomyces sp. NBC_00060 TaxID=2975636 RepID=A0AAU2GW71_9ACTN